MQKNNFLHKVSRLKVFLLAAGLTTTAPSSASTGLVLPEAAPLSATLVQPSLFLGGVSLQRTPSWSPAPAYRIEAASAVFSPIEVKEDLPANQSKTGPGVDPMQTAAIIPGVFGSVAISMRNFPAAARWSPVYKAIAACSSESACGRGTPGFAYLVEAVRHKGFTDKLAFVNSGVNQLIAYRKDQSVYGTLDYWATPSEILNRRAGDCEDFAILKMTALLQAGVPAHSMSLVVLQDRRQGFFHAVLSVSTSSGTFILDSLNNKVVKDTALPDYVPLYSFSTDRAWVHGSKSGRAKVAEVKGGYAAIVPGEGSLAVEASR